MLAAPAEVSAIDLQLEGSEPSVPIDSRSSEKKFILKLNSAVLKLRTEVL